MEKAAEGSSAGNAVRHVVLIDDEDDCTFVSKLVLKKAGYRGRITCFTSGAEALEWLRTAQPADLPDMVFVDIHMPVMNGFQLLEACGREGIFPNGRSTVIMFSGSILPMDIERARAFPFVSDYAEKALDVERFHRFCADHLRRHAA
ncbi:MAG: response regulator [Flavobacteriales bacterium]